MIKIKREVFDPKTSKEKFGHLTNSRTWESGMWNWLSDPNNEGHQWMGWAPKRISVAYDGKKVVGWSGIGVFSDENHYMAATYVDKAYRGTGVGAKLFKNACRYHRDKTTLPLYVAIEWKYKHAITAGFALVKHWF